MASTAFPASQYGKTQATASCSLPNLQDRLDSLWTSYLHHLDAYTTAQKALQQDMRSGFFSLSRANFKARPGMRYGKDYFHDRAIATTRIKVEEASDGRFELHTTNRSAVDFHGNECTEREKVVQQPSPPATPDPEADMPKEADSVSSETDRTSETTEERSDSTPLTTPKLPLEADPLRWYGILVPQELRSAKVSFTSVVDGNVAQTVNASRAMRAIEVQMRKLRKEVRRVERAEGTEKI